LEKDLHFRNPDSVSLLLARGAVVSNLRTAAALGDIKRAASCFDETGALTTAAGEIEWPFNRR
jgi:hypothetical protein